MTSPFRVSPSISNDGFNNAKDTAGMIFFIFYDGKKGKVTAGLPAVKAKGELI
jgi:hypothetical protein